MLRVVLDLAFRGIAQFEITGFGDFGVQGFRGWALGFRIHRNVILVHMWFHKLI